MRADARRNRERITTAALRLFAERGPEVSMEEIARAAGLGVGTLYRHFPDRRALAKEIAAVTLEDLLDAARAAIARDAPRWDVLRAMVAQAAGRPMSLLKSLLEAGDTETPRLRELQDAYNASLTEVVRAAQDEGTLRRDLSPDQVMGLFNLALCRPGARADDAVVTVVLDGLRSRGDAAAGTGQVRVAGR
ncbi:helix-turn-helix domain-containing protein [Actinomadura miaoliensis]|uniref:TetR/AcrR family transcriptional regulator n=1 Tax=Actinomadura miaoliensis TaxID=430685 RepID=A0ABP7WW35_9ACTN